MDNSAQERIEVLEAKVAALTAALECAVSAMSTEGKRAFSVALQQRGMPKGSPAANKAYIEVNSKMARMSQSSAF